MNKRSNKGFTLVELLIAMSIFSIVIGIGYNVLNKTHISIKNQSVITNGQSSANLINKYVTKDLEQIVDEIQYPISTVGNYEYKIKSNNDEIIYKVVKNSDKKIYNVVRENEAGSIEIVTNQPMNSETPFVIKKNNVNNNIYEVCLEYKENKNSKEYKFSVAPRLVSSNNEGETTDPVRPPEDLDDDEDFSEKNAYIKFGYEANDDGTDKIWTDAGPHGNSNNNETPRPIDIPQSMYGYNINVDAYTNTGNGKLDTSMSDGNYNVLSSSMQNNQVLKKEQNRIKITKYGEIDLSGEIRITYKHGNQSDIVKIPLENQSKIYNIEESYNKNDQYRIQIIGKLRKPSGSNKYGEIVIQMGKR